MLGLFCWLLLLVVLHYPCTVTFHFYTHYTHVINNLCPLYYSFLPSFLLLLHILYFLFNHISKNFPCCCCLPFGMIIFASVFHIFYSHSSVTQFVGIRKFISHCVCVCVRCEWWKWWREGTGNSNNKNWNGKKWKCLCNVQHLGA